MLFATIFISVFGIVIYVVWKKWNDLISRYSAFSGPPPVPLFGNTLHLDHSPPKFFKQLRGFSELYNHLYMLWFGWNPILMVGTVDFAEYIFKSQEVIGKTYEYVFFQEWLGTGLLTSTGKKWKKRRKAITPSFHFAILNDFAAIFEDQAKIFMDRVKLLGSGKAIDVQQLVTLATLDVISESAMGVKLNAQINHESEYVKAIGEINNLLMKRSRSPWLWLDFIYQFTPSGRKYYSALKLLHTFTIDVINKQIKLRSQPNFVPKADRRKAFLDTLLDLYDKGEIDVDGIREEVDTFMFEGHDTTASGISWTLYMLGKHPEVQRKLQKEVDAIDSGTDLINAIRNMKYLEYVLKESLRLHPPVSIFGRLLETDEEICGRLVPRNTSIYVDVITLHTNPDYWDKPLDFYPDRFGEEAFLKRNPYCYIPFSAGLRNCVGQKFAMLEQKVLLYHVVSNFELESSKREIVPVIDVIQKSENGLYVEFKSRDKKSN